MRSYNPEYEGDKKDLEKLNAEPWMIELLRLNPEYVHWGPHEDAMCGKDSGWASAGYLDSWQEFRKGFNLDELNECVNFYFELGRDQVHCLDCDRSGLNPATRVISKGFYGPDYSGGWSTELTQDEVDALIEEGRLGVVWNYETKTYSKEDPKPTAAEVNAFNREHKGFSPAGRRGTWNHDAINRWILIETRAKRLGVWGHCEPCQGDGSIFTAPGAHVNLILWWLHPRKGCSKGIEIKNIQKAELTEVFAFLKEAADRNAERFARVVALASVK